MENLVRALVCGSKYSFLTRNDKIYLWSLSFNHNQKIYETTQVTRLSRDIRRLFRTISNFRKPIQSLLMSEIEEEPCQRREDIEKVCSYDFLTEHKHQQVSTPRSCESVHSFETDGYETLLATKASERLPLPTSETTEGCVALPCNGSSTGLSTNHIQLKGHARLRVTTI